MAEHKVYTFYAVLNDYKPKLWRRFEINGEKTIAELSYAIMIMFEMRASHLFALTTFPNSMLSGRQSIRYEFSFDESFFREDEILCEPHTETLNFACLLPNDKLLFEYGYGDGWEISLVLEEVRKEDISLALLPRVTKGKGYGIVENVGGVYGLENLAKVLKKVRVRNMKNLLAGWTVPH